MDFNPDCIKELLIYLEDKIISPNKDLLIEISFLEYLFPLYSKEEVIFHIFLCNKYKLFKVIQYDQCFFLSDLHKKAIEVVSIIKNEDNWNEVKEIIENTKNCTLNYLIKIVLIKSKKRMLTYYLIKNLNMY